MQFLSDAVSYTAQVTVLLNPDLFLSSTVAITGTCSPVARRYAAGCGPLGEGIEGRRLCRDRTRSFQLTWCRRRIVELAAEKPVADTVSGF